MKKGFSWITALLASFVLLAVSCSNANQVTWTNNDEGSYTSDGLSEVTVKVDDFINTSRTIYPDNWTEESKSKLVFHLHGDTGLGYSKSVTDMGSTDGRFFLYEQIRDNKAVVKLDPTTWNLTLDVYTATADEIKAIKDELEKGTKLTFTTSKLKTSNKTLSATANPDLSTGSAPVTFNLKSAPGDTAQGTVNVEMYFLNPTDVRIDHIDIQVLNGTDKLAPEVKETVSHSEFAKAGSEGYYFHAFNNTKVPAGEHNFEVKFLDKNGKVVLLNSQKIIVEGGNTSSLKDEHALKLLDIDEYGKIPAAPTNLSYKTYFKPATEPKVINEAKKIYAQEIDNLSSVEKNYNIELSWLDNANNEYGYKVILTSKTGDAIEFTYDPTDYTKVKANEAATNASVSIATGSNLAPAKKGETKTVTIVSPLTQAYTKIEVLALNPYVNELEDKASVSDEVEALVTPIGMFTVGYNLVQSGNGVTGTSKITYSATGTTSKKYFVMGYPYGTTVKDLVKGEGLYPFVSLTNYEFGSWMKGPGLDPAYVNVVDEDLVIDKLLTAGNIEVYAGWLTNASVQVVFPDYSTYKTLGATKDNHVNGNVIKPIAGKVSIALPTANVSKPVFKIYRDADNNGVDQTGIIFDSAKPNALTDEQQLGITLSKTTIDNDTLNWNTETFATKCPTMSGGVYRVEVQYNYNAGETTYTGNLYVDFNY